MKLHPSRGKGGLGGPGERMASAAISNAQKGFCASEQPSQVQPQSCSLLRRPIEGCRQRSKLKCLPVSAFLSLPRILSHGRKILFKSNTLIFQNTRPSARKLSASGAH